MEISLFYVLQKLLQLKTWNLKLNTENFATQFHFNLFDTFAADCNV